MAIFVVDASAALAWCFEDEQTSWADGLLERLRQGDEIAVPAHWPTLVASRGKRIKADQTALFWDELARLPIEFEPALTAPRAKAVLALGEKYGLTVYDAAYLELALRRQLPLGTLDAALRKAAQTEGIALL